MSHVQSAIDQAVQMMESLRALETNIRQAADLVKDCLVRGGKLLACGNGGSAGDVSDFTTEYVCRFVGDRRPFPAINLTADGSLLTATGNDYGFEEIFARQVNAFGKNGDVLVVASTSGQSKNILRALEEAGNTGSKASRCWAGDGGKCKGLASVEIIVNGPTTARIQEAHKFIFHVICELVEPALQAKP